MEKMFTLCSLLMIAGLFMLSGCDRRNEELEKVRAVWKQKGIVPKEIVVDAGKEGEFRCLIYSSRRLDEWGIEVLKGEKTVFFECGEQYDVLELKPSKDDVRNEKRKKVKAFDITGDGVADLVIERFSGGAHCCFSNIVLSLEDEPRVLGEILGENGAAQFKDLDGDGRWEVLLADWVFQYWKVPFAESPAPDVVLEYDRGYRLAPRFMRAQVNKDERLKALWQVKDAFRQGRLSPVLWRHMLRLIYSGNGNEAYRFVDDVWPNGIAGKRTFLAEFKQRLSASRYWKEIKAMNDW